MTGPDASPAPSSFTLAYVPGVTPTKWVRIWNERLPAVPLTLAGVPADGAAAALRDGEADAGLLRLPVDRTELSAIPLYTETTVVVVPKDHLVAAVDEVTTEDLADDVVLHPLDDTLDWERLPGLPAIERPATTADAVELVAAGVGVLLVPQSLARLHHRRDLTYRPVTDAPVSEVALSWREDATTDLVEQFIGIVRGRTVNSSRGPKPPAPAGETKRKAAAGGSASGKTGNGTSGSGRSGAAGAHRTPQRKGSGGANGNAKGANAKGANAKGAPRGGAKRGRPRKRPS